MKTLLLTTASIALTLLSSAQSAGPNNGKYFQNVAFGEVAWTDLDNVSGSDDATAVFDNLGDAVGSYTDYLVVTGFKFSIPPSTRILGIEVTVETADESESTADNSIRIVKGGQITGIDHSEGDMFFNVNVRDHYNTYGGPTDLWGEEWNAEDINDDGFGFAISAKRAVAGPSTKGAVDDIKITIYYTLNLSTLPIKLISFSAIQDKEKVKINWKTSDESSMDHFEIERSSNGTSFTTIGSKPCNNRALVNQYSFEDANPVNGTGWYRLKMVGMDGTTTFSKIVMVYHRATISHYLFPSPWKQGSTLFIKNPGNAKLKVVFYSATGEMITRVQTNSHQLPTPSLGKAAGNLHYKIYDEREQVVGAGKISVF